MSIILLVDPDRKVRPKGAIRADVAWKLYMPDHMGDVSSEDRKGMDKFVQWLWRELADRAGFMRRGEDETVYIITPPLTDAGSVLMARICSIWSDNIYRIDAPDGSSSLAPEGVSLWKPPVVNVLGREEPDPLLQVLTTDHHDSETRFLMPALGSSRAFMRTYKIREGATYSRLHSHSAVEEHYLVLEGMGTLRFGGKDVEIKQGDLVSKPVGPDNSSQFIADRSSELSILDIEIWPDTTHNTKDVVLYPDHREILFRGQGWGSVAQDQNLMPPGDFNRNYDAGYERQKDGSWTPKKIPGVPERKK